MRFFTSESVSEGHPDKIADQISDGILDALITQDQYCHVACETLIKMGMVMVAGEINTLGWVDVDKIARNILTSIGYNDPDFGLEARSCTILSNISMQSKEIANSINHTIKKDQGAGDQGIVFGFACNETSELMPLPIMYAHKLMRQQAHVRKNSILPWARPDAKVQITVKYDGFKPIAIETILLSIQHDASVSYSQIYEGVIEEIIKPVIPEYLLTKETKYIINPSRSFVIGGSVADCGLTGRKIIVDTYGGMSRHGGGAFSGKDPSKIDRSSAYMARYLAKNIVKAELAERCEIQIAYSIGVSTPLSLHVNCDGTNKIPEIEIENLIKQNFSLTPYEIITKLKLLNPIYLSTACYGHFGRENENFMWEELDSIKIFC